ncbi:MAG: DUF4350 domain-containing protein [Microbacterium sp.]
MTTVEEEQKTRRRARWGWVALIAGVIAVTAILSLITVRSWSQPVTLSPDSPAQIGARALTNLLDERGGITVTVADTKEDALDALNDGATLAIGSTSPLQDDDVQTLVDAAGDTVLLDPTSRDLRLLLNDSSFAGYGSGAAVSPQCDLAVPDAAGKVAPGSLFTAGDGVTACYGDASSAGLLQLTTDGHTITAVDGTTLFTNAWVAQNGNAALGLGLLGTNAEVVWYLPKASEAQWKSPDTIGDLTPGWVTPVLLLAGFAAAAAGVWRGRRFGPLVPETLPVTVRATETMEGRARLYAKSNDPAHAAELLRRGAASRMAKRLALARTATPQEVADAAAIRLGVRGSQVHEILLATPTDDATLAQFTERLRDLEAAVDAAIRTERNPQ